MWWDTPCQLSYYFFPGVNSFQFSHNSGSTGGAMAMFYRSQMIIQCGFAKLQFIDNHATQLGGAIYVQDLTLHNYFKVFYEVEQDMCWSHQDPDFHFINNTAQLAGSALYGGWIDSVPYQIAFTIGVLAHLINDEEHPSLVPSDLIRVCMCVESTPNCTITELSVHLFPGQTYGLSAVAVGQRFGIVPSIIQAQFNNTDGAKSTGELDEVQQTQNVGLWCTNLTFTLRSSAKKEKITLSNSLKNLQTSNLKSFFFITKPRVAFEAAWDYLFSLRMSSWIFLWQCKYAVLMPERRLGQ